MMTFRQPFPAGFQWQEDLGSKRMQASNVGGDKLPQQGEQIVRCEANRTVVPLRPLLHVPTSTIPWPHRLQIFFKLKCWTCLLQTHFFCIYIYICMFLFWVSTKPNIQLVSTTSSSHGISRLDMWPPRQVYLPLHWSTSPRHERLEGNQPWPMSSAATPKRPAIHWIGNKIVR